MSCASALLAIVLAGCGQTSTVEQTADETQTVATIPATITAVAATDFADVLAKLKGKVVVADMWSIW